jgi:hypothetical protein
MVADLEGDLTDDQEENLNRFLSENPNARLEYALFKKTRLIPGTEVLADKDDLKKKPLFVAYRSRWITAIAVAASLILFIGLYFGNRNNYQETEEFQMAETEKIEVPLFIPEDKSPERISSRSMFLRNTISEETTITAISPPPVYQSTNIILQQLNHRNINRIVVPSPDKVIPAERHTKYALFLEQEVKPEENRPGFVGRFMQGLFRKTIPKMDQKSFLEYTLDGYNLMSDRDVELEKQYDERGKVVAYRINGENIRIGQRVQAPLKD